MRRWKLTLVLIGAWLFFAETSTAQYSFGRTVPDYAVGVGVGLDRVGPEGFVYVTGNFRFGPWNDDDDTSDDEVLSTFRGSNQKRMKGFLEAEIGYWKDSTPGEFESDLLIGVNALALVPSRAVDVVFGVGFGVHFLGAPDESVTSRETRLGANLQFGVDLNISEGVSYFALGRYDLLSGDTFDYQAKILGGFRYRF